jgi:pantoate--beta-alanine ligase
MHVIVPISQMRALAQQAIRDGRLAAFVPTMGYLHEGHLALVNEAQLRGNPVVLSVFVNPFQFGPGEDYARYPRDFPRDRALAESAGVDTLWAPEADDMYPEPPAVTVDPGPVGTILEGAVRPGHFTGVLTVVLKLLSVVQPSVAIFGRKDAQQAWLVRRMVRDFNTPVEVVVAPTMRDYDGLALSSRNVYLNEAERAQALALPRALAAGVAAFRGGERRAGSVVAAAYRVLAAEPALTVEYINVIDAAEFQPSHAATESSYLAAAVRVGGPTGRRLIDNVILGQGVEADPVVQKQQAVRRSGGQ